MEFVSIMFLLESLWLSLITFKHLVTNPPQVRDENQLILGKIGIMVFESLKQTNIFKDKNFTITHLIDYFINKHIMASA